MTTDASKHAAPDFGEFGVYHVPYDGKFVVAPGGHYGVELRSGANFWIISERNQRAEVVAQMESFVEQAQSALERLKRGEVNVGWEP